MKPPLLDSWLNQACPIIGMLHLRALPGAPAFDGDLAGVRSALLADAETLVQGGVDGLLLENFGDPPFYPRRVPHHVVAHLTALAGAVRARFAVPLGINVLRNDGQSAIAIAQAVGAQFVRVNVLCGARVTDQGIIEGIAHRLLRERVRLGAGGVRIFADVDVKHSAPLGPPRPIEEEIADCVQRGGADALVASGPRTGSAADPEHVRRVKAAAGEVPVLLGSGVSAANVATYARLCDGIIVGSSLKAGGQARAPVDPERVRRLVQAVRGA